MVGRTGKKEDGMKHLLTGCPICGGKIYRDDLYQYAVRYTINKNGYLSRRKRIISSSNIV